MKNYCTILDDDPPSGRPHRFYRTREAALRAGMRRHRQRGDGVEIVWCRDGVPKVWLAYVTPLGVEKTRYWTDD